MRVIYYKKENGKEPVKNFISSLERQDEAKINRYLSVIKKYGIDRNLVPIKQIKDKLWEIKNGIYRIFYLILKNNIMVLLHAYKKESRRAPKKELALASKRMKEVLSEED